ncbi:MAG TPA: sigma 54 modulation/S30EA ribosomal C-terminal domain-containing protein [Acidimicrobiales bacterium]|nr:sigma 54 modulation/S30EA ribosomal C-terminal domain-containing protein [Acidimicrobiales bacterium]
MPDGVVQWFDPKRGEGAVVRGGHVFAAAGADVEPVARRSGAHVHFDIRREAGTERAVSVRLRRGRRAYTRQGRFGSPGPEEAGNGGRTQEVHGGAGPLDMEILTRGEVGDAEVAYALERVGSALRRVDEPLLFGRLKLELAPDPARPRPALLQVTVDVNGEVLRAHVDGHDLREAADLLERRVRDKLEHRAQHRKALRTAPGERPAAGPAAEQRPLHRHTTFAVGAITPDEAAFDMDQLGYEFHLYRDLASGHDALLERLPDGSRRLTRLGPLEVDLRAAVSVDLVVAPERPPVLEVEEAVRALDELGIRYLFFEDAGTGRGCVAYRRSDGDDGLVTMP